MATGAYTCDLAILLINAYKGMLAQAQLYRYPVGHSPSSGSGEQDGFSGLSRIGVTPVAKGSRYHVCAAVSISLGFSDDDRRENIRRVSKVAKLMVDTGLVVLTAFISPHRDEWQKIREMFDVVSFIEVFVDTPLAICEACDTKGLYKKARSGELRSFTGIDAVFEAPQ